MPDFVAPLDVVIKSFTVICLIMAALLLIWPNVFVKMNLYCKKWFSTSRFERELNKTRDIDSHLMSMRKLLGIACLVLAIIFIIAIIRHGYF